MSSDEETITRAVKKALQELKPNHARELNVHQETEGNPLPFSLNLDGGGDWTTTEKIAALTWWICPKGVHEVYFFVRMGNEFFFAPDAEHEGDPTMWADNVVGVEDHWFPFNSVGYVTFSNTGAVVTNHIGSGIAPKGYLVSGGERFTSDSTEFRVRFRRVG